MRAPRRGHSLQGRSDVRNEFRGLIPLPKMGSTGSVVAFPSSKLGRGGTAPAPLPRAVTPSSRPPVLDAVVQWRERDAELGHGHGLDRGRSEVVIGDHEVLGG